MAAARKQKADVEKMEKRSEAGVLELPHLRVRRSSRRTGKPGGVDGKRKQGEMDLSVDGTTETGGGEVSQAIDVVMDDLALMEVNLQQATKRQKRKVASSRIMAKRDEDEVVALKPRQTRSRDPVAARPVLVKSELAPDVGVDVGAEADEVEFDSERHATEDVPVGDVPERGAARPPPVHSDYLPLPWRGRLGYACLNTYLRSARPPVFSSRTCRMSSIVDHRHPLLDPSQPEHAIKNRPDKTQEPSRDRGDRFVQELGLANARDIVKMLRWNDRYNIKFMRLSSEMFPFASHPEHGYKLEPFAADVLADAGRVVAELGHRVTTHPGQFTQLGSPRKEVIVAAVRDLEYHNELLTLLRLPEQQDRDAVLILHMGGVYGDKAATLDRFRENYAALSPAIKARLVLENDDVAWSVHDLLPICEELNIPLVLDYHHHNIIFDSTQIREGTYDISQPAMTERIAATWTRKGIRQKMHYSEPCPGAVTGRDRRKHSPRVMTLPPCRPDADLMIEAKDKEQAVFELMRTFKLPGYDTINDMIPHERDDEDRPAPKVPKKQKKKKTKRSKEDDDAVPDVAEPEPEPEPPKPTVVSAEDFGMGGPMNRVYWHPGMEEWLRPKKREVKSKPEGKGKVKLQEESVDGEALVPP